MTRSCAFSRNGRRGAKRARDRFDESTFLAQDEPSHLCECEVLTALRIGFQPRPVRLVRGKTLERDQSPRDVVGALVRQEITDQIPTTAGNDPAPVFGVLTERFALGRVDVVADEARDGHGDSPVAATIEEYAVALRRWFD